jgi:hypothetical protein
VISKSSERAFHSSFFNGGTEKERDTTALNNGFIYAVRYAYEKVAYSYYAKTLEAALQCKSQLKAMGAESQLVKL